MPLIVRLDSMLYLVALDFFVLFFCKSSSVHFLTGCFSLSSFLQIAFSIVCVEVHYVSLRVLPMFRQAAPLSFFVCCIHHELRGEFVEWVLVSNMSWSI